MFHGANGDTTGVNAACWYGAMYGYHEVPEGNFKVSILNNSILYLIVFKSIT